MAASATGGTGTESWLHRIVRVPAKRRCLGRTPPPQGACENLVCALKLLANQQTGGDSFVDTIFEGLQEQSRLEITTERRRFHRV